MSPTDATARAPQSGGVLVTVDRATEILLVRAIEESGVVEVDPGAQIDALEAAGDVDDERAWFARRSAWLLEHPLAGYRSLLGIHEALIPGLPLILGLSLALGLSSNYLGPESKIHVLYNPIALLILWNLGVYVALGFSGLLSSPAIARRAERVARAKTESLELPATRPAPGAKAGRTARRSGGLPGFILRRSLARIWLGAQRHASGERERAKKITAVGARFWTLWDRAARPLVGVATRRALHIGAAGIALGAVLGMFVRGLFFDYNMVWRSTFIEDPEVVATFLRLLLGPAALALGWPAPGIEDARLLMTEAGASAERWIWLYALTTLFLVVVPRGLLAARSAYRARSLGANLDLHLDEPYFAAILAQARDIRVAHLREMVGLTVRTECAKFAEGIASYVVERLYDREVVPELRGFREQGGRIVDLETRLRERCEDFDAELRAHVQRSQTDFERSLTTKILEEIGRDIGIPAASAAQLDTALDEIRSGSVSSLGDSLSSRIVRPVSIAVTAGVATVAGAVSGGFGETIGAAILVGLLGTTGPVGWIIGALVGLVAAVAALWVGRDRIREGVRRIPLPAAAVRAALREKTFEALLSDGRERCIATVRDLIREKMDTLTDELAEHIWGGVKPVLARMSQPDAGAAS